MLLYGMYKNNDKTTYNNRVESHTVSFIRLTEILLEHINTAKLLNFMEKIRSVNVDEGDILVSFDVQSLFTSCGKGGNNATQGCDSRQSHSSTPSSVCRLTELCFKTTYFEYQSDFYE